MNWNSLTEEQKAAGSKFLNFLMDESHREFYLFGSAGCGKTFLARYFIEHIHNQYLKTNKALGLDPKYVNLSLTATTNKAVEVLHNLNISGVEVETVYQLFGVTVKENYSNGTTYLNDEDAQPVSNTVIFVDECSMLPIKMLNIIRHKGKNSKIVFIGDRYQLAPVKEKPHWNRTPEDVTVNLTKPVRNQGCQPLIDLCTQLRNTVETGVFNDIKLVPGVIEHLDDEGCKDWLMKANFEGGYSKVLCYTNEKVLQYQDWIQTNKYKGIPLWCEGRSYINTSNYEYWDGKKMVRFYPEQLITINKIHQTYHKEKFRLFDVMVADVYSGKDKVLGARIILNPTDFKTALKWTYKSQQYEQYFKMKNTNLDLRLPFACTVHKAQGNTYDEVLIDLDSFKYCRDPVIASRLLYVAASRAKKKVCFYGTMPKKYGVLV